MLHGGGEWARGAARLAAVCGVICLVGCGDREVTRGPARLTVVGKLGPVQVGLSVDENGNIALTSGLVPRIDVSLGPVGLEIGIEDSLQIVRERPYQLVVLRQDSSGNVERLVYDMGRDFELTFDRKDWVHQIKRENESVLVVVETLVPPHVVRVAGNTGGSSASSPGGGDGKAAGSEGQAAGEPMLRVEVSGSGNHVYFRNSREPARLGTFTVSRHGGSYWLRVFPGAVAWLRVTGDNNLIFVPASVRVQYNDEGRSNFVVPDFAPAQAAYAERAPVAPDRERSERWEGPRERDAYGRPPLWREHPGPPFQPRPNWGRPSANSWAIPGTHRFHSGGWRPSGPHHG